MPYSCIGSYLSFVVVGPCYSISCYRRSSCGALVYIWVPYSYNYAPGFAKLISGVRARAIMINLWVSNWILPLVSRILFDPVIPIDLSLDGHSC